MIGDTKIKKAIIATLFTMLMATAAYATTTWYFITSRRGGLIHTTTTIDGTVLYSYDNKTWRYEDIYFDQSNKLYVAFNVTYISPSSAGSDFNFTFRLFNSTGNSNVTSFSVVQKISSAPVMVNCTEELSTYLVIGNTYTVYVDIYKDVA
jgi:hypothetical protein